MSKTLLFIFLRNCSCSCVTGNHSNDYNGEDYDSGDGNFCGCCCNNGCVFDDDHIDNDEHYVMVTVVMVIVIVILIVVIFICLKF